MATGNDGFQIDAPAAGQGGNIQRNWGGPRGVNSLAGLDTLSNAINTTVRAFGGSGGGESRAEQKDAVIQQYVEYQDRIYQQYLNKDINQLEYEARSRDFYNKTFASWGQFGSELTAAQGQIESNARYANATVAQRAGAAAAEQASYNAAVQEGLISPYATPDEIDRANQYIQRRNYLTSELEYQAKKLSFDSNLSSVERDAAEARSKELADDLITEASIGGVSNLTTLYQRYQQGELDVNGFLSELSNIRQEANIAAIQASRFGDRGMISNQLSYFNNVAQEIEDAVKGNKQLDVLNVQNKSVIASEAARLLQREDIATVAALADLAGNASAQFGQSRRFADIISRAFERTDSTGNRVPGSLNEYNAEHSKTAGNYIAESISLIESGQANEDRIKNFNIVLENIGKAAGNTLNQKANNIQPLLSALSSKQAHNVLRKIPLTDEARNGLVSFIQNNYVQTIRDGNLNYFDAPIATDNNTVTRFDAAEFTLNRSRDGIQIDFSRDVNLGQGSDVFSGNYLTSVGAAGSQGLISPGSIQSDQRLKAYENSINRTIQLYANVTGLSWKEAADEYGYQVNPDVFPPPQIAVGGIFLAEDGKPYTWNGKYPWADPSNYDAYGN